jgi:uncharacterized DUF497 family protein
MLIDFSKIVGFDWDEGNVRKSADKHFVSPGEAEQVFIDRRLLVLVDEAHSGDERRFHAYGQSADGRLLLVSFTLRQQQSMIRIISARSMSRRERERYAEET